MCNVPGHPPTMHNPSPPHARCSLHHNPTSRMKMRSTCAMIDASALFLCFSSNPCKLHRFKETARCCLPNNIRLWRRAHKTGRIAQPCPAQREKKTQSTCATDTDACAKKSQCEKSSDEVGAAARVGRASGSAAAGVRLRLASLVTPATKARSHPTRAR